MERINKLPGYEVSGRIAEGGMATVWLARQVSLDRQVAIKILSPDFARDEEARTRFYKEAQAAARLNHPGIVQIYDAGEHGGSVYMVMEYVNGCTVAELLERKKRLSERHALLVAEGIALALDYAWNEAKLIHCDVKPDNVLVAQDGSVKLADLGLARFIGAHAEPDMIEGTPHYASPEQVRGELDLDCRTDIYSLGAMLYHLVTGQLPFADSQGLQAMKRQMNDYLPDPTEISHSLSANYAWLIEKMMVKDRTQRYRLWPDVLRDVTLVQSGERPTASPPSAGQSTIMRSEARVWVAARAPDAVPPKEPDVKQTDPTPVSISNASKEENAAKPKQKKIVLPKDLRRQVSNAARAPVGRDLAREIGSLILMLLAVLAAYGTLIFFHVFRDKKEQTDSGYWSQSATTASQIRRATTSSSPSGSTAPRQTAPRPAQSDKPSAAQQNNPENWQHPTYVKGALLFNGALEKYTQYQKDKQNPEILKTIEQQCREAIRAFEFVKPFAPKDLNIQRLIDQCYHLISDTRHSTLLVPASSSKGTPSSITQASHPTALQQSHEVDDLILAPSWNAPQTGASGRILDDLAAMLRESSVPNVDLSPDTSLVIFGQIFYLMPAREAARIIGKPPGVRRRLNTPGFPKDSFHYYTLAGDFGNGFDQIYLVTDSSDRIAAVQLLRERSDKELWLDAQLFQDQWSTYNFVEAKTKGNPKWKVALRAEKVGRVLRIDSELVSGDSNAYFGLGDSKSRASLYLPESIANIILYRISELQK